MNALLFSLPGHAGPLLRRRDRHGRQHLPRRSRRRAHADAVERRPQRRLLARQPAAALPAGHHRPRVPLRGGQRRGPAGQPVVAAVVDEAADRAAQAAPGVRPRRRSSSLKPDNPQGARVRPRARATSASWWSPTSRASPSAVELDLRAHQGAIAGRAVRPHRVPADRRAAVLLTLGPHALLLVRCCDRADRGEAVRARPSSCRRAELAGVLGGRRGARLELGAGAAGYRQRRWFRGKARDDRARRDRRDVDPAIGEPARIAGSSSVEYDDGASRDLRVAAGVRCRSSAPSRAARAPPIAAVAVARPTGDGERAGRRRARTTRSPPTRFGLALLARHAAAARGTLRERGRARAGDRRALRACAAPRPTTCVAPRIGSARAEQQHRACSATAAAQAVPRVDEGPSTRGRDRPLPRASARASRSVPRLLGSLEYGPRRASRRATRRAAASSCPTRATRGSSRSTRSTATSTAVWPRTAAPRAPARADAAASARRRAAARRSPRETAGAYLDRARLLGMRTARAAPGARLRQPDDPAFAPEPFNVLHQQSLYQSAHALLAPTFERAAPSGLTACRRGRGARSSELLAREADDRSPRSRAICAREDRGRAHPRPRRLPPRPGAATPARTSSSSTSRASRRARCRERRLQALAAARRRRHAALVPLRGRGGAARRRRARRGRRDRSRPGRRPGPSGSARRSSAATSTRPAQAAVRAARRRRDSRCCSTSTCSRSASTRSATSWTIGPTGSTIPLARPARAAGEDDVMDDRAARAAMDRRRRPAPVHEGTHTAPVREARRPRSTADGDALRGVGAQRRTRVA